MQVIWLPQALTRLMQLYEYGKFHFGQKSAEKLMNGIRFDSERLVAFPYLGSLEPRLSHLHLPYRSLVVHNHYKLIYRVSEEEDTVYVVAVWDTRRNPQDMDAGLSDDRE